MAGYQADVGANCWGAIYDESRRARFLSGPPSADDLARILRAGEWNSYRILCEGPRIRVWINGEPTADFTEEDAAIPLTGRIALQIHSGEPTEVSYRNLRLRELRLHP